MRFNTIRHELHYHQINKNTQNTMSGEQFSLVWNSFPTNLSSGLYTLLTDEHLVDVTLTAEGQILRAHKLILSVCSSYFRELFEGNMCKHPIVILKDVNYRDLSAMLHFMYQGEVNIKQEDISSFLKLAETLQIKGLTKDKHSSETTSDLPLKSEIPSGENSIQQESSVLPKFDDPLESPANHEVLPESFVKLTSSDSMMRSMSGLFGESYKDELPAIDDEPLDCTSEMREIPSREPLNYKCTTTSTNDPRQDYVSNSDQLSYSQDCQKGIDQDRDEMSYSRGKRTLRGMQASSIGPLESTLRVVSELGPTLRVERGKIVRMYSCPWCLRHFTRKENLKLHVRYIHGPLESLTCKLCGNKYKNSNSLRVHSYLYHNAKRNKHAKPPSVSGGPA